jgi:hypothetical protein
VSLKICRAVILIEFRISNFNTIESHNNSTNTSIIKDQQNNVFDTLDQGIEVDRNLELNSMSTSVETYYERKFGKLSNGGRPAKLYNTIEARLLRGWQLMHPSLSSTSSEKNHLFIQNQIKFISLKIV